VDAAEKIKSFAYDLKIPFLLHFTRAHRLPSILSNGLYPVDRFEEIGLSADDVNDGLRLDGHLDGISLSIAFPNHLMFYKYRNGGEDLTWVVLAIDTSVLWNLECAFCCHNAADGRISSKSLNDLGTLGSFQRMFEEQECLPSRGEQRLRAFDPTDAQAEVLVFGVISPGLIKGAVFNSLDTAVMYKDVLGDRTVRVVAKDKSFFASRKYFLKAF
jgi:hypothetical protein